MKQTVEVQVSGPGVRDDVGPRPSVYPQVRGYGYYDERVQPWFEAFVDEYESLCRHPMTRNQQRAQFCTWHDSDYGYGLTIEAVNAQARKLASGRNLTPRSEDWGSRSDSNLFCMWIVGVIAVFSLGKLLNLF